MMNEKCFTDFLKILFTISTFILFSIFSAVLVNATQNPNEKLSAQIYKGKIEDAAEFIATIPTEEEARKTYNRLKGIVEDFKSMMSGKTPPDADRIDQMRRYVIDTFRKTEVLEWCLFQLHENQTLSLLPGEGITLTFRSYCLNHSAAGPDKKEFYSIDKIPDKQAEWLTPLLDYCAKHKDESLPVQGLIWNMTSDASYYDLPEDQQQLLRTAVPDAEQRYGEGKLKKEIKSRAKSFLKSFKRKTIEKAESSIEIIDDINEVSSEIERRKSKLKLILPKHDVFRLENGLLVRVKSTGHFNALTLTIVNPKSEKAGIKSYLAKNLQIGNKKFFLHWRKEIKTVNLGWPYSGLIYNENYGGTDISSVSISNKWGKGKDWWNRNKGKIKSASEKAGEVVDLIDSYNEVGLEGVGNHVKGRGFDEGLDFFKGFHKGNPEAENAFKMFRNFNKSFLDAEKEKENRPNKKHLKKFKPSRRRYKPGRKDVQPLAVMDRI